MKLQSNLKKERATAPQNNERQTLPHSLSLAPFHGGRRSQAQSRVRPFLRFSRLIPIGRPQIRHFARTQCVLGHCPCAATIPVLPFRTDRIARRNLASRLPSWRWRPDPMVAAARRSLPLLLPIASRCRCRLLLLLSVSALW